VEFSCSSLNATITQKAAMDKEDCFTRCLNDVACAGFQITQTQECFMYEFGIDLKERVDFMADDIFIIN